MLASAMLAASVYSRLPRRYQFPSYRHEKLGSTP